MLRIVKRFMYHLTYCTKSTNTDYILFPRSPQYTHKFDATPIGKPDEEFNIEESLGKSDHSPPTQGAERQPMKSLPGNK